jgi:arylsulfatase A-like enzyme
MLFLMFQAYAEKRPNIIFFLTDDQRFDFLGCAGHPILQTPNIDRLAKEGTRFENMFVTTSTCWISRATMFSGLTWRGHRYPHRPFQPMVKNSYPAMLKNAGYQVGYVGKHHVKTTKDDEAEMFHEFTKINRNPYFKPQSDGSLRHTSEINGDIAIDFLKRQKEDKPFCLSVSFNASHAEDGDKVNHFPYPKAVSNLYLGMEMLRPNLDDEKYFNVNPEFLQKSMHTDRYHWRWDTPDKYQHNMRNYLRMISGVDHVIGRVLTELKSLGMDDNTIVIYAADNGYYAGDRKFAGKWTHYEQSLRVPLIVYDPRVEENKGKVEPKMALNVDIPATILDYAGVKQPKVYQGKSLKPLVEGEQVEEWREDTIVEFISHHASIPNFEGIRGERYVYARYVREEPHYEFLHDLKKDPTQLKNFANNPEYKEILEGMRKRMDQVVKDFGGELSQSEKKPAPKKKPMPKKKK